jgi:uncharacterized protein with FMN-binding domain
MKRIVLWFLSTLSAVLLLFGYHTSTTGPLANSSPSSVVSGATAGVTPVTGSTGSTSSTGSSSSTSGSSGSGTKSGGTGARKTVTGSVAQTRWGPVQVELVVRGGKITKVSVVQYPHGNGRDQEINSQALPVLIQETEQSQSASIDMVSGATVTSTGYHESLQSALDKAGL